MWPYPPFLLYVACADGYLTPCIQRYVRGFASGFKDPVSIRGGGQGRAGYVGGVACGKDGRQLNSRLYNYV